MMLPLVTSPKVLWDCAAWAVLQRWAGENRYAFSFTDRLCKGQTRRQLPNGPSLQGESLGSQHFLATNVSGRVLIL